MATSAPLASAIALALLLGQAAAPGEQPVDPVVAAAQARQQAIHSFDVEYKVTETIQKGAISLLGAAPGKPWRLKPDETTTLASTNRLAMSGDNLRREQNHPHLDAPTGKITQSSFVTISNRSLGIAQFRHSNVGPERLVATIEKWRPLPTDFGGPADAPILWAFRGVNGVSPSEIHPTGKSTLIDGVHCQEYRPASPRGNGRGKEQFWFDAERGHTLGRARLTTAQGVAHQVDIHYQERAPYGWVPVSWQIDEQMPDGKALITTKVQVVSMKLNEPQPPDLFEFRFPPGTVVYDQESDSGANKRLQRSVVQADGSMRPDETPTTPAAAAPTPEWTWRDILLVGGSIAIVLAAIVLRHFLLRRRLRALE